MKQHVASAQQLVAHLATKKQVARVHYPGLESHPGHAVAKRQMKAPGGMISFDLHTGARGTAPATAFLKALRVFVCAESLGGVESLAELPAVMTHASLTADARRELGIGDGLIRLSVGLEDIEDLKEDLDRGFRAMEG
jgi:cystathionine beta-lyase/cystathionine gamma-synthase